MGDKRIIPVLTMIEEELVKTRKFDSAVYLGDPMNAIRIFNEKEVDELAVLDIRKKLGSPLDFTFLQGLSEEAFMPLMYGGGVSSAEDADRLVNIGFEKICFNSTFFNNPSVIEKTASRIGSQSTILSLDVRWNVERGAYDVYHSQAKVRLPDLTLEQVLFEAAELGIGEIILQNVDRDGTFEGLDLKLAIQASLSTRLPLVLLGGAKDYSELESIAESEAVSAVAAGSLFVFKHQNRESILINYPERE